MLQGQILIHKDVEYLIHSYDHEKDTFMVSELSSGAITVLTREAGMRIITKVPAATLGRATGNSNLGQVAADLTKGIGGGSPGSEVEDKVGDLVDETLGS